MIIDNPNNFVRNNLDVLSVIKIDCISALTGGEIEVETLTQKKLLKFSTMSDFKQKHIFKNEGAFHPQKLKHGDFIIIIEAEQSIKD